MDILDLTKSLNSQTTTKSTSISQQGLNSMLQSILESTQGLSAVSGAKNYAGLYNSSTNTLLTNDLLSRAAGQVAQNTATTTTKTSPATSAGNITKTLVGLKALGLANDTYKKYGSDITDVVGNLFSSSGGASVASSPLQATADTFSSALPDWISAAGNAVSAGSGVLADSVNAAGSVGSSLIDSLSSYFSGYANGGRIPRYANGGRVTGYAAGINPDPTFTAPTLTGAVNQNKDSIDAQVNALMGALQGGTVDTSKDVGEVNASHPSGMTGSDLAQFALAAITGNPISAVTALANMASRDQTGKGFWDTLMGNLFGQQDDQNFNDLVGGLQGVEQGTPISTPDISVSPINDNVQGQDTNAGTNVNATTGGSAGDGSTDDFGGPSGWAGGDTSTDGGTGFAANGMKIPGHDLTGRDDKMIRVSGGEQVLPTDVVDAVNAMHPGFFDDLISMFHNPLPTKG